MAAANSTKTGFGPLQVFLFALAMILLVAVAYNFYLLNQQNNYQQEYIALSTDVRVLSQQLAKSAGEAAVGNFDAFTSLRAERDQIANNLQILREGNVSTGLPPSPQVVNEQLSSIETLWSTISENATDVSQRETLVQDLGDSAGVFSRSIPVLQVRTDQATRVLTEAGAPAGQIYIASRQLVLADRLLRHVGEILQGGQAAITAADNLNRDSTLFSQVVNGLIDGNAQLGITPVRNEEARVILTDVQSRFDEASSEIDNILASSVQLSDVRLAADDVFVDSGDLSQLTAELSVQYRNLNTSQLWPSLQVGLGLGALALLLFFLIGLVALTGARQRSKVAAESNQRNQEAILRLLDEMSTLAEGDLSFNTTVTEDITGAIADSVNYAVEQLRNLVVGINHTARQVSAQAQETRATATQLAEASEYQSNQIRTTTDTINSMNNSFTVMAKQSGESAEVATHAVGTAVEGASRVRETIEGMDAIRSQIQETSKRIKRLGESSQEIGDIVELINGISEQTNMLALNAAIQAASAGGAGRGFAVVADEVQRLAERATNATRRIESLVQGIQNDTNEAVNSMEATTSQVVRGARTAEDAGTALSSIESVSKQLADLITGISKQSEQHTETASKVAQTMNTIRDISDQTRSGTGETAESVQQLAELVRSLSDSVADFKLPSEEVEHQDMNTGVVDTGESSLLGADDFDEVEARA